MIELGIILSLLIGGTLAFVIVPSFISHRYWRRAIAGGDAEALRAAVIEALDTWRRMRPPQDVVPSDWRALQSAELIAADTDRCRVSLLAEPDIRVIDGVREQVGSPETVARRAAVKMAERLLYDIPLSHFQAVQVDVYTQYRSPDGQVESDCLLTTQLERGLGAVTDWDDMAAGDILETWTTRELRPGELLDPEVGAIITAGEMRRPEDGVVDGSGTTPGVRDPGA